MDKQPTLLVDGPYHSRMAVVDTKANMIYVGRYIGGPMALTDESHDKAPVGKDHQRGIYIRLYEGDQQMYWRGWLDIDQT